jgi:hypothetical protein
MRIIVYIVLFCFVIPAFATERIKGISESVKENAPMSGWFKGGASQEAEKEQEPEKEIITEPTAKEATTSPDSYWDEKSGCVMQKAYTLDVENPEQYERLEDYPFTYECSIRR